MKIEKVNPNIKYIYHYTLKENVEKILKDKAIISKDPYVFFTKSLNDSISAFENEIMQEGKLYIDVDGNLKKREKCNKSDYCILKIPYVNDNQFYKFTFENQSDESIYKISLVHKGAYHFKNAKVLQFPNVRKNNMLAKKELAKKAIVVAAAGIILVPHNLYAANWLDANNYDISWYINDGRSKYEINTAKELAGLAHLVNNENVTFEYKRIKITDDIDLTENTWQTISDAFKGEICGVHRIMIDPIEGDICGIHRIILNYLDGKFIENQNIDIVDYSFNIIEDDDDLKKINVQAPYTVKKLKDAYSSKVTVFFNNEKLTDDTSLFQLNLQENERLQVFTRYNYLQNISGVKIPFAIESGDPIDRVKEIYSAKSNIPVNKIILKYNGTELKDGRTLADYNIQKEETINAYAKIEVSTSVNSGKGTIVSSQDTAISGEEITITVNPEKEYELDKLLINGEDKTTEVKNKQLKLKCYEKDIKAEVNYKLKKSAVEEPEGDTEQEEPKIDEGEKTEEKDIKDDVEKKDNENSESVKTNEEADKQLEQENKAATDVPKTGDNKFIYVITLMASTLGIGFFKTKGKGRMKKRKL